MSVINPLARELTAKIVYYGPGMSGKTTSLSYIHKSLKTTHRGELISLATEGDRTLYFDFLPVKLGRVRDLNLRLQLYTVPGQVFYGATRRLVLEGADGVVFVADSQRSAMERNQESLEDLEYNLLEMGHDLNELPFVLQYNKRDLPDCEQIELMREKLNKADAPDFATNADKGVGVAEALKTVTRLVTEYLSRQAPDSSRVDNTPRRQQISAPQSLRSAPPSQAEGFSGQVSDALSSMGGNLRHKSIPPIDPAASFPGAPELSDLGTLPGTGTPQRSIAPRSPLSRRPPVPENDAKTIQAPAASPLTFSSLWKDGQLIRSIEQSIATGHFAEAVYRSAGGVSEILDLLLGPHSVEGSATRAQLLGVDGHEYLHLRRLASRPAASLTQNDALFALYLLIAVRIKESRL